MVVLAPATNADDRQAGNHVTFMLNFFDDVQRRVELRDGIEEIKPLQSFPIQVIAGRPHMLDHGNRSEMR
jgi:hypothetical protein